MARSLTTQDVSWFLDLHDKGQLDLNPPYQRKSVWSTHDKRYFIDTILNNYPAPPIFLHKTLDDNGRATYHVVDGKQRLQSILQFRDNKIAIPESFYDANLRKKKWKDLDKSIKESFWNYILIVEMMPDSKESAIRDTFERINRNSRKLTEQEMRHAKYDGWFISKVEAESELDEWRQIGVVTTARAKRMSDAQFISELMMVIIKRSIDGFDQDTIDEIYASYDDVEDNGDFVEDHFLAELKRCKATVLDMLLKSPGISVYTKANGHLYTLWSILALRSGELPEVDSMAKYYLQFMKDVSLRIAESPEASSEYGTDYMLALTDYVNNIRGASTDFAQRQKRYDSLFSAISFLRIKNAQE